MAATEAILANFSNISTTLVYYSLGFPLKATYKKAMTRQTQNTKFRRNFLTR
jgi:hypothetical protein